jgi:hypothetical protein
LEYLLQLYLHVHFQLRLYPEILPCFTSKCGGNDTFDNDSSVAPGLFFVCYCFFSFFFFLLWYWDLNSGPTPLATPPALFCDMFFRDGVSQTICLGWLLNRIFLISAS